ncbi:MAG: YeeE/YedE family protein, partial [Chromatiales bacterium]|nr:YeeE/YedE family protein [Chromatiales bacterium]
IMALLGVIAGSFLWAIISKGFRIEWFNSTGDFVTHLIGAILMGFGGVLAMGCTIGQGITGVSTLAIGSFITFISIVYGSALTMKVQYYKMVYEEDATFAKALITGMVDLKLLPSSLRKLDAI